jgi:hypothetical protein
VQSVSSGTSGVTLNLANGSSVGLSAVAQIY